MKPLFADDPLPPTQTDSGDTKTSGARSGKVEVPPPSDESPEQEEDSRA